VGVRLALDDFTLEQVTELNRRYGSPLANADDIKRLFTLLGGQPYLVRRGLHDLATKSRGMDEFEQTADRDEGPFSDHLRRILVLLAENQPLCASVRDALESKGTMSNEHFYRLRSAGVMAGESAREVRPRCRLYAKYLERHLL
jgi:hypothetical protein